MSTMKKLFALVLALAMIMSVSAFAYNDADAVNENCEAAVTKLSAMGLFKGDTKGNFNPEGTLTRAEAATLIYRIRNNGSDAGADMWASTHPFTDVNNWNGGWAAGYIGYCYNYNIIIGRTTTTFDPGAPVKGTEFAKMLLIAIGYKAEAEGFNDSKTWSSKVVMAGDEAGLFKQYGIALGGAASRQWVAKMLDNALDMKVPSYMGDWRVPSNSSLAAGAKTVGEEFLGFTSEKAVVVANDAFAIEGEKADSKKTMVKFYDEETKEYKDAVAIDIATALDMIGQEVIVAKDSKEKVINVIPTGKSVVGDLTVTKTSGKYTAKAAGKTIIDNKASGNLENVLTVNFSINGTSKESVNEVKSTLGVDVIYNAMQNRGSDMTAKAYDYEGDGTFDAYVLTTAVYGVTATEITSSTKNTDDVEINVGDNTLKVKRNQVVAATLAEGAVVKVDVVDAKIVVTPVSAQVGLMNELEGVKAKIAGVVYTPAADDTLGTYVINKTMTNETLEGNLGKDVVVYVTDGKKMIKAPELKTEDIINPDVSVNIDFNKIAYVIDVQEVTTTVTDAEWGGITEKPVLKVKLLLANGTTVVYTYDENSKVKDIVEAAEGKTLVEAVEAKKDSVVEFVYSNGKAVIKTDFTEVKDVTFNAGDKEYSYTRKTFGGNILAKDSTVVFVKYTKSDKVQYGVMKMSDFKSAVDGVEFNVIAKTTSAIADALIVSKDFGEEGLPGVADVVNEDQVVVLVTGTAVKKWDHNDKDGNAVNVAVFKGINLANVAAGSVEFKCNDTSATVENGKVYTITMKDGKIEDTGAIVEVEFEALGEALAESKWVNDSVKAVAANVILIGDVLIDAKVDLASGCVILKKSGSNLTAASFGDIIKAKTSGAKNIVIATNAKAKISMIIFTADGTAY